MFHGQHNQNRGGIRISKVSLLGKDNGVAAGLGGHIARNYTQPKRLQNFDYFKDKMLLMQAQKNGVVLDEEEILFLVGEQPNTFDADVDNQTYQNLKKLKYQNLKERFGNKKPVTSSDAPSFDSVFVIGKLNEHIQSRGNTIRKLKEKISRLTKKNNDADPIFDLKALVSQNKDLTAKLNAFHDLNECFRAENAKVKQHYKELYDSIKITHAKTTDQNNSLLSEIENLKAQLKDNSKCVTIPDSKPKVLAPGRYPIDVEPIPPRHKNNREVHLHYMKHLMESVETLRKIVEDAKVERSLDTSLASAFR
ncbi:hypothetical protein Tco_0308099 [Tanacetum coccineum]